MHFNMVESLYVPFQYPSTKTMLMRNIGDAEAKFTMDADKYVLEVHEFTQLLSIVLIFIYAVGIMID